MRRHSPIRLRSLLQQTWERLRGRDQLLVRAGEDLPLFVFSFPRARAPFADHLRSAVCLTYRQLSGDLRRQYSHVLPRLPSLVVVLLRGRNLCSCLGHHHPPGTESHVARRLAADTGLRVGEIDLAVEAIRAWEPLPLASLAAQPPPDLQPELDQFRFHAALLAVFLHELEHLAFPDLEEGPVRRRSTDFYAASLREFFSQQLGASYGI